MSRSSLQQAEHSAAVPPSISVDASAPVAERRKTARGFQHDWVPAAFYLMFDVLWWLAIYSMASFLRREGFSPATPFGVFLVEMVQLAVIVAALFIIGGYDRHTETRSLSYTA